MLFGNKNSTVDFALNAQEHKNSGFEKNWKWYYMAKSTRYW